MSVMCSGPYNPLHVTTMLMPSSQWMPRGSWLEDYKWVSMAQAGTPFRLPRVGKPVHSLAAFEYLMKGHSKELITDNLCKEWNIGGSRGRYSFDINNGFMSCMYNKLKINVDFYKFQDDYLKNVL